MLIHISLIYLSLHHMPISISIALFRLKSVLPDINMPIHASHSYHLLALLFSSILLIIKVQISQSEGWALFTNFLFTDLFTTFGVWWVQTLIHSKITKVEKFIMVFGFYVDSGCSVICFCLFAFVIFYFDIYMLCSTQISLALSFLLHLYVLYKM